MYGHVKQYAILFQNLIYPLNTITQDSLGLQYVA